MLILLLGLAYLSPNLWYRKSPLIQEGYDPILSFDDGPTEITREIGEILYKEKQSSIFFIIATEASQYVDTLEQLEQWGHEIGYHCYRHVHPLSQSPWKRYHELVKGYEFLCELGFPPKYYRPCHGFYTLTDMVFLKKYHLKPYHWTSLLKDWEKPKVSDLVLRMNRYKNTNAVLVLHDGSKGSAVPDAYRQIPKVLMEYLHGGSYERQKEYI